MLPARIPTPVPGGLLANVIDMWHSEGWDPSTLHRFRMGPEDDALAELEGLSDEELTALEELSDDDVAALNKLTSEQRSQLTAGTNVDEADLPDRVKAILTKERTSAREATKAKRAADRSARSEKDRADRAEAEVARLKKKPKPDDTPDPAEAIEAARREADEAATKRSNRAILEARIEAAAASKFATPTLAVRLLDLDDFEVDKDGRVDRKAIDEALDELLEENPGLAAKAKSRKPKPDGAQGRRGPTVSGADAGKAEAEKRFGKKAVAS